MSESTWYLYMIECANGHLYTGVTLDIVRRFSEHESGGVKAAKFLRGKGPLKLVYQELVGDRSAALKREIKIKSFSRKKKLMLISSLKCINLKVPS
ncbi:GIY-YIG nuclease family protein [Shewanella sp. VB17]|uniref:GIY-YIG nuclease family protein n=1 Tax=Shewanella sp. VB17 TaxID=2739432 RepID=UPI0015643966|nr:GIY-YIG nuclease family protein [Shewanella sp. VB17]NRD71979.1 GIY-YIG nuclease family protein [Shewanella sp. VB17]